MDTKVNTTKKLISINNDTKKVLSHLAIDKGMSLNKFIERILQEAADAAEDAAICRILQDDDKDPDNRILSDKEQEDFINSLIYES